VQIHHFYFFLFLFRINTKTSMSICFGCDCCRSDGSMRDGPADRPWWPGSCPTLSHNSPPRAGLHTSLRTSALWNDPSKSRLRPRTRTSLTIGFEAQSTMRSSVSLPELSLRRGVYHHPQPQPRQPIFARDSLPPLTQQKDEFSERLTHCSGESDAFRGGSLWNKRQTAGFGQSTYAQAIADDAAVSQVVWKKIYGKRGPPRKLGPLGC
jgi:hypothetical protein